IGVAVADAPEGPFRAYEKPIPGVRGIDPCVLQASDGHTYLYWSGMGLLGARVNEDLTALESTPVRLDENLPQGFKEGPFIFEREGRFYLTYPWVQDKTETLAYAMSDHPLGPYKFQGLIMAQSPNECWTNHHSLVQYKGEWYLFYHHNDYSPAFDKNRSVRIDKVSFNPDGTILPVTPTFRGVGLTPAWDKIQLDRYSALCHQGACLAFLDEQQPFEGWFLALTRPGTWVRYDRVDFGESRPGTLTFRYKAGQDCVVSVSTDETGARFDLPVSSSWRTVSLPAAFAATGLQNLRLTLEAGGDLHLDWISFDTRHWETYSDSSTDLDKYMAPARGETALPDPDGFIRRWLLLEPISKPHRSNNVFTETYLREVLGQPYFPGQLGEILPKAGSRTGKLRWHAMDSRLFNVKLFRFASSLSDEHYGLLYWMATVVNCERDIPDVRLSVGSNGASMWWVNGEEAVLMDGDRRMVADDCASERITLKKGRNVIWGAVINGPGLSDFCVRFLDGNGQPVTHFTVSTK
ncbi:MAG: family 43 glycosylhydrolase, partial [Bacteroidales bacterium]|nr:family 43 glycosylhydrolase [Bacteroidales bacterium]